MNETCSARINSDTLCGKPTAWMWRWIDTPVRTNHCRDHMGWLSVKNSAPTEEEAWALIVSSTLTGD